MKKYAIGIDLGGTSVKYALIDNEGVFHFQGKLPSKADVSAEAVIGQLVTACKEAMASALQLGVAVEGIGIGTPGIVDETNRIVLGGAENIKGWENLNLADRIEAETGLPVQMGNDANLMGLGETMYGAGQGAQNVVFLTVGTGIGGAVVIGGKLFNGFANRGTELGHVPLIANGEPCACGSVGCLEHYASTSALVRRFSKRAAEAGISFRARNQRRAYRTPLQRRRQAGNGVPGRALRFSGTRHRRIHQHLQPATHRNRRRTVRSRRLLYPESQREGTPLCHSRLCREHSNHGCIFR